jgi:hypothetical protein
VSERGDIIDVITRRELLKKVGTAFLIYTSSKAGLNITRSGPKIVEESRIVMKRNLGYLLTRLLR